MNGRIGIANLVTALVFGVFLAAMAWGNLAGPRISVRPLRENRDLAVRPAAGSVPLDAYPEAWEAWFNDHFAYRAPLVRAHSLMRLKLWRSSAVPRVLPGRRGWLFYDGKSERGGYPRANYLGRLPDRHDQVFRGLQAQLESTRDYFRSGGADYLLVVVPDKWSVYGRHLPPSVGEGAARTSSDLFLAHLAEHSDLEILDLKPVLRAAAREHQVFHRQDTHWNDRGAFAAARAIAGRIAARLPETVPPDPSGFQVVERDRPDGDLVEMLGLDGWLSERVTLLVPRESSGVRADSLPRPEGTPNPDRFPIVTRGGPGDGPRVLMLRDSFGDALWPFLASFCEESGILWTSNHTMRPLGPLYDDLGPDLVIEMRVEKYMLFPRRYFVAPGAKAFRIHPGKN